MANKNLGKSLGFSINEIGGLFEKYYYYKTKNLIQAEKKYILKQISIVHNNAQFVPITNIDLRRELLDSIKFCKDNPKYIKENYTEEGEII